MVDRAIKALIGKGDFKTAILLCRVYKEYELGASIEEEEPSDDKGICLYNLKRYQEAFYCFSKALGSYRRDTKEIERILNNRWFCIPYMVGLPVKIPRPPVPLRGRRILLSMTTCKRLSLFIRTLDYFLANCLDHTLIDRWIVVDDNSSIYDREEMKRKYPWIDFILKDEKDKGHAKSMNIIRDIAISGQYEFLFHLEDDWEFIEPRVYLSELTEIISCDTSYGQALVNKNYMENHDDFFYGSYERRTPSGRLYYLNEYIPDGYFSKYKINLRNCSYWKHFSLRPGITRVNVLEKVGPFAETGFFEGEYAQRYIDNGFQSVFLPSLYCCHIGKLTYENSNTSNSYELNNIDQQVNRSGGVFTENQSIVDCVSERLYDKYIKREIKEETPEETYADILSFVLNLDRRPDRWEGWKESKYTRFPAIDGMTLKRSFQLASLFSMGDFYYRKGMIGCSLSHIQIWINFYYSDKPLLLVLEDDTTLSPYFDKKLRYLLDRWKETDTDILFLGHFLYQPYYDKERARIKDTRSMPIPEVWSHEKAKRESMGGTIGYVLNKRGVKGLLDTIETVGNTNGIDWMMIIAQSRGVKASYSCPHLVFSRPTLRTDDDSDIQHSHIGVDIGNIRDREIEYYKGKGKVPIYCDKISNVMFPDLEDLLIIFSSNENYNENRDKFKLSTLIFPGKLEGGYSFDIFKEEGFTVINGDRPCKRLERDGKYDISSTLTKEDTW